MKSACACHRLATTRTGSLYPNFQSVSPSHQAIRRISAHLASNVHIHRRLTAIIHYHHHPPPGARDGLAISALDCIENEEGSLGMDKFGQERRGNGPGRAQVRGFEDRRWLGGVRTNWGRSALGGSRIHKVLASSYLYVEAILGDI